MPVTGRLSSKFYEHLGDDVTNEVVDWMNFVDLTYRTRLKESNDLFWERMTATLKSEMASLRHDLRADFDGSATALRADLTGSQSPFCTETASLHETFASVRADLLKWMFVYSVANVLTFGALLLWLR